MIIVYGIIISISDKHKLKYNGIECTYLADFKVHVFKILNALSFTNYHSSKKKSGLDQGPHSSQVGQAAEFFSDFQL